MANITFDGTAAGLASAHSSATAGDHLVATSNATWGMSDEVTITKAITLRGTIPGTTRSRGAAPDLPITLNLPRTSGQSIKIDCPASGTVVIRDLNIPNWKNDSGWFFIYGTGGIRKFRFTNLRCDRSDGEHHILGWVNGPAQTANIGSGVYGPYGLFDHITSDADYAPGFPYIRSNDWLVEWERGMTWGTEEAVYIEDSEFFAQTPATGLPFDDGDTGCRKVARYCSVKNVFGGSHGSEGDPSTAEGQGIDSHLQSEIYRCDFTTTFQPPHGILYLRGGSALVHHNTLVDLTGGLLANSYVHLAYFRAFGAATGGGPTLVDRFVNDADAATFGYAHVSSHAVNPSNTTDYLGTGQPGCGSVTVAGEDPNFPARKYGSVPIRVWNNNFAIPLVSYGGLTFPIGNGGSVPSIHNESYFMLDGRDFHYSGYGDDSAALGGYTEFTYPHPLVALTDGGGGGGPSTPLVTVWGHKKNRGNRRR